MHMQCAYSVHVRVQVHSDGGEVVRFRSVCGGLPAPESAFSGNPFGYKFSWSPAGVLAAMHNAAQWREGGEVVRVAGAELLRAAQPLSGGLLGRAFSLEVLPNRDALPYAALYGIEGQAAAFSLALALALALALTLALTLTLTRRRPSSAALCATKAGRS